MTVQPLPTQAQRNYDIIPEFNGIILYLATLRVVAKRAGQANSATLACLPCCRPWLCFALLYVMDERLKKQSIFVIMSRLERERRKKKKERTEIQGKTRGKASLRPNYIYKGKLASKCFWFIIVKKTRRGLKFDQI
jgi:hypothetical protein